MEFNFRAGAKQGYHGEESFIAGPWGLASARSREQLEPQQERPRWPTSKCPDSDFQGKNLQRKLLRSCLSDDYFLLILPA